MIKITVRNFLCKTYLRLFHRGSVYFRPRGRHLNTTATLYLCFTIPSLDKHKVTVGLWVELDFVNLIKKNGFGVTVETFWIVVFIPVFIYTEVLFLSRPSKVWLSYQCTPGRASRLGNFRPGVSNPGFWTPNKNLISNSEPGTDQVVPSPVIKLKVPKFPKRIYAFNIKSGILILRSDNRYEKTGSNNN